MARKLPGPGIKTKLEAALAMAIAAAAGCDKCNGKACDCTIGALAILGAAIGDILGSDYKNVGGRPVKENQDDADNG